MDHLNTHLNSMHNPYLVSLSIMIAVLASYTALDLAGRITAANGRAQLGWLIGGAVAMGLGIWSMHFTAMLAFQLQIPILYDVPTVLVSLLVAIVAAGFALFIASRPVINLVQMFGGGIFMGLAIAGMHYIGMAAMRLQATLTYEPLPFIFSIVIAIVASIAALWLAFRLRGEAEAGQSWKKISSAVVMGAAISGMHYMGMVAATFTLNDKLVVNTANALGISLLGAVSIVVGTFIVLGFTLLLGVIDRRVMLQTSYIVQSDLALQKLNSELETRVAELTHLTEVSKATADVSRHLSAILNFDQLLVEIVNGVEQKFGYYHAHIYLLDKVGENLVMAEGTGEAGSAMKIKGHSIPLNVSRSLVARAARTGEIVRVDNVRETPDWLPNPLLPNTYSEMAVPIVLEDQVVGVLDVQEDEIGGLDEGDATLLLSLSNQIAIAIRNTRLFAEVETALNEAREIQRRYLAQSWDRTRVTRKSMGRVQFSLGESTTLNEAIIESAQQQALRHKKPTVVALDGQQNGLTSQYALVAPIVLRGTVIGDLQLHEIDPSREWTDSDLALISAVIDQVAQVAETLRLLDETQERASREELVSQISNKMRRAPDMESLLKVAVTEMSRVLTPARTFVHMNLKENSNLGETKLVEDSAP